MYDIAIIGLGRAGLEALKIALKNNLKVIAFEQNEIGGDYLNYGYLPTKSLSYISELLKEANSSVDLGLNLFSKIDYNWQKILDYKMKTYVQFNEKFNSEYLDKITLIKGPAEFSINDEGVEIYANDNIYLAKNIVVATGSKPKTIKGLEIDHKFIIEVKDLFKMQSPPKKITIIGSNPNSIEWAKILSNLGSQVKIIEQESAIAPYLDIDMQKEITLILRKNNVELFKNDTIIKLSNNIIHLKSQTSYETDCILYTGNEISIVPKATVGGCSEAFILKAFEDNSTEIDNLYIIGSANLKPRSIQDVTHQAKCVMNKILNEKTTKIKNQIYTIEGKPQFASIGLREQDIDNSYTIKKINLSDTLEASTTNNLQGFIKIILKDEIIKGAHIVSQNAFLLASFLYLFIENKTSITKLKTSGFICNPELDTIRELLEN